MLSLFGRPAIRETLVIAELTFYNASVSEKVIIFRRRCLVVLVMSFVASVLILACEKKAASPPASSKPNVLLVTFDTTRADYLSCYGHAGVTTPTIDTIAREGIRFANCSTVAPITLPAHATIMTGLYPFQHKLRDNGAGVLDDKAVTLAELFRGAGYRTGAFVGAYVLHSRYGLKQGFDVYSDEFKGSGAHMEDGTEFAERRADAVTDAALAWLDQKDDRPVFLWVHYFDAHAPYEAPGRTAGRDLHADYAAEISYADRELGRVVGKVDELSKNSNRQAWQIITADHGEGLGEHDEETHGLFTYDSTLHVPLIIKGPGVQKGGVVEAAVSLVQFFPSVVRWLQLPLPYEVAGDLLTLDPEQRSEPRPLYFESYVPFNKYGWSPLEGVIAGREKYIHAPVPVLYDIADMAETKNLAGERPDRVHELASLLDEAKKSSPGIPSLSAGQKEFDEASLKKLQSLGYVSNAQAPPTGAFALPDPKSMNGIRHKLIEAERLLATGNESGAELLAEVLDADPNNFRALHVLADFVSRPRFRASLIPIGRARLRRELAPPYDVEVPAAVGLALCRERQTDAGLEFIAKAERIDAGSSTVRMARAGCMEQPAVRPPSIKEIEQSAAQYLREKNFAEAKRVLIQGAATAPDDLKMLNSLAMLLATCPDDTVRDGTASLRLSTRLAEKTNRTHPAILSTLAAAQAETGDYAAAIETATHALELVQNQPSPLKGMLTQQLESFRAGKPYRSRVER